MGLPRIRGTSAAETIVGTDISEEIRGEGGNDTIHGGRGHDLLRGGSGNDFLFGDDGNDRLRGDRGDDTLTGGAGNDRFIFNVRGGTDTVTDYTDEADRLDFTNFGLLATGAQTKFDVLMGHAEQVGANTVFTMDGGETIILENVLISVLDAGDFRI